MPRFHWKSMGGGGPTPICALENLLLSALLVVILDEIVFYSGPFRLLQENKGAQLASGEYYQCKGFPWTMWKHWNSSDPASLVVPFVEGMPGVCWDGGEKVAGT